MLCLFGLSVVTDCLMFQTLSIVLFIRIMNVAFDFYGSWRFWNFRWRDILLTLTDILMTYVVRHARESLIVFIIENDSVIAKADAWFAWSNSIFLIDFANRKFFLLSTFLNNKSDIIVLGGLKFVSEVVKQTLQVVFDGVKFYYFRRHWFEIDYNSYVNTSTILAIVSLTYYPVV